VFDQSEDSKIASGKTNVVKKMDFVNEIRFLNISGIFVISKFRNGKTYFRSDNKKLFWNWVS